jgi:hypothetical protein
VICIEKNISLRRRGGTRGGREGRGGAEGETREEKGIFSGEAGFDEAEDEQDKQYRQEQEKEGEGEGDEKRKVFDVRGIGREEENEQEQQDLSDLIHHREKIMKHFGMNGNYRGILSSSSSSSSQANGFEINHIFLDRDPKTLPHGASVGLYDCYLDYRQRYLLYHSRYVSLTTLLVQELEQCFLLCHSLSTSTASPSRPDVIHSSTSHSLHTHSVSDQEQERLGEEEEAEQEQENWQEDDEQPYLSVAQQLEEKCIEKMKCLEMMFHDLLSLQHELLTLLQIIHSSLIAIEMAYYENIFQFSQTNPLTPSNIAPSTRKFSYTRASSMEFSSYSRVYNPSCPISSAHLIRCLYPTYALSAVYLGYFYLTQEVASRFNDSLPETKQQRPNSRPNNQQQLQLQQQLHQLHCEEDSISYKSLIPLEEGSEAEPWGGADATADSISLTSSSLKSGSITKRKAFNPTKGRKMNYPTKGELKKKQAAMLHLGNPGEKMNEEQQHHQQSQAAGEQNEDEEDEEGGGRAVIVEKNLGGKVSGSFPPLQSSRSQTSIETSAKAKPQGLQNNAGSKSSLPLIPLSSRTIQSGERDDVSALTTPGGSHSNR